MILRIGDGSRTSGWCNKWISIVLIHILASLHLPVVNSFNLDSKFPLFFKSPNRIQNTYFGYAVDFYVDADKAWVVVGAPKSGLDGQVYRCYNGSDALSNFGECEIVNIEKSDSPSVKQMLGSTILIGKEKQLLSCAPKFSHTGFQISNDGTRIRSYYPVGACYLTSDFTHQTSETFLYLPCINRLGTSNGHDLGFCQAGFSASFLQDDKMVLLGAVGSYYNQGSIILLNGTNINHRNPSTITNEINPVIPDDWPGSDVDYYRQSYDNNYMGYSLAVGKARGGMTLLATSAPRRLGFDLLGAVNIYDEDLKNILINFTGRQIGEYFGHGLAFVDVNNDALDDLIVGSPLYTDDSYRQPEIGRIYIYYQEDPADGGFEALVKFSDPVIINGNASMGRFGHTITSLGDVNNDGYQDFLVSAPYESGEESSEQYGALYVFNGRSEGVSVNPSQIIQGVNLDALSGNGNDIRGLGFASKGGKDMDQNGYPDLVAGAYLSDKAVMIRARPVVTLMVKSTIQPNKIDLETLNCEVRPSVKAVCFQIHSCFSYDGKSLPPSIEFFYDYDADSTQNDDEKRAFLLDTAPRDLKLTAGSEAKCVNETVYLKKEVKDKLTPIAVTLSYWLKEKNEPVEPVLDIFTGTSSTVAAEISKNCGSDNICTPDLEVTMKINPPIALVGKYTEIVISSNVTNNEENAYQTLLVVQYPKSVSYINVKEGGSPIHCVDVNSTVICEVANPLKQGQKVPIDLRFGIHDLAGDVSQLIFHAFANCSNEQSYVSPLVQEFVFVEVEANIEIFNASLPEIVALDKLSDEDDEDANVTLSYSVSHTYEITNMGPSSIASAKVQLLWPLSLESGDLLFGLDDVVTVGPVTCDAAHVIDQTKTLVQKLPPPQSKYVSDDSYTEVNYYNCKTLSEYCSEITCTVDAMRPREDILITFKGKLHVGSLLVSEIDSIITSSLVFEILTYPYDISIDQEGTLTTSEVSTAALFPHAAPPASVDWWVIAVAVAGGVLFLLIIIIILWRCGFFKRKTIPSSDEDADQQQQLYQAELIEKEQEGLN